MTSPDRALGRQLEQLREAFDQRFALPEQPIIAARTSFIAIGVGDRRLALRTGDVRAIFTGAALTVVPSRVTSLLGLARFHDSLLPVHDLGPLLGTDATSGRWMAVDGSGAVAWAFSSFDGPLQVDEVPASSDESSPSRRDLITGTGEVRQIVDLPAVLAILRQDRTGAHAG